MIRPVKDGRGRTSVELISYKSRALYLAKGGRSGRYKLASVINRTDYWKTGRGVKELGLAGKMIGAYFLNTIDCRHHENGQTKPR